MKRDKLFKYQRALDTFEKNKRAGAANDTALRHALAVYDEDDPAGPMEVARLQNVAENGRWLVILLTACWLAVFMTGDKAALFYALLTASTLGLAWIGDQAANPFRAIAVFYCVAATVGSIGALLLTVV